MTSVTSTDAVLPKPPGLFRQFLATHPLAVDVFIVVWYFIGAGIGVMFDYAELSMFAAGADSTSYLDWPWWPFAVLRVLVVAAALLYRRKFPLIGLFAVTIATLGPHEVQSAATFVALCFMLYAVPVYRSVRAAWAGYGFVMVVTITQAVFAVSDEISTAASNGVSLDAWHNIRSLLSYSSMPGLMYLAIVMFGINLGNRRRYVEAIIERAHQLVDERDQRARLAVAEERARISREMHDIVAHSLSVMIALSEGSARAAANAPEAASDAMRKSAETGRTALAEMRRLLGALRSGDDSPELAPQPGMDDLADLAQGFRDTGLRVGLRIDGQPSGDRGQELAVYRAVQEALTNVLRYAGRGAQVNVTVRSTRDATRVTVRDFGPVTGAIPLRTGLGAGLGLAGLKERARMLGGEAAAGPAEEGPGWEMRVRLPAALDARDTDPSTAK
ncbi:signal transduction histidine kinase [Leucobacter exalbidus]|uniref:histidine kinase n=1 Tax=Leucobacter exalbidus TaxID=662960 RepID=A0A940PJC8_9MICO|nr:histidine kinase [Leucobacter exalbidus]MBP1324952.1 signal transduction histidine kinase [Leucobacter exalbidus]